MNLPKAKDPRGLEAKYGPRKRLLKYEPTPGKQVPWLMRVQHTCGHELCHKTEVYNPDSVAALRQQLAAQGCGNCAESQSKPWYEADIKDVNDSRSRRADKFESWADTAIEEREG